MWFQLGRINTLNFGHTPYEVAKELGLQKSSRTFKRWLAEAIAVGKLSAELEELGLEANFKARREANPKDNSVRWLRFEK